MNKELLKRFKECYLRMVDQITDEEDTSEIVMCLIRDKHNKMQVQLKVTKDEYEMCDIGWGEVIADEEAKKMKKKLKKSKTKSYGTRRSKRV